MTRTLKIAAFLLSLLIILNLSATGLSPIGALKDGRNSLFSYKSNVPCSPAISVTPTAYSICANDSVQLIASGAVTYTWTPVTGLSCTNCANPYAKPAITTTYTVAGTNASNCIDSAIVTVTVGGIIVTVIGSQATICQGTTDTLTASGADSYVWNTGATTSSIIVNPASTFTYNVVGTSLTCQNNASFIITVNPLPVIFAPNKSICLGSSTLLNASGATNYLWAPSTDLSCTSCQSPTANPTSTIIYTIIGTDNNGCSNSTTDTVTVVPLPTVSVSSAKLVCEGVPAILSAAGSPPGGSYLWQPGNNTTQSVTDTPSVSTVYTVTYSNGCPPPAMDTVSILIAQKPTLWFTSNQKTGCAPLCMQFTASSIPANIPILSWNWSFGDSGTASIKDPPYCYAKPGTYTVTLTVQYANCQTTSSFPNMITVYPIPQAAFTYSPNPVSILDPVVSFTDQSSGSYKLFNWIWNFGDNPDSTYYTENPTHTYADTGRYCTQLIVIDANQCRDTTTQCFNVETNYTFYIPSAFTPNGLIKTNNTFCPAGTDIKNFEMYIFDRWGMQVYYTTNMLEGWNGSVRNGSKMCQEDVYVYTINVTDTKELEHHYIGTVTLLK